MSSKFSEYIERILASHGFYKSHKESYASKIVDYPESPTGKAYIGVNKAPLMPAVDGGHGYQGVLLQDDNRQLVQCHSCGDWMQKITSKHIEKCSGLTLREHKLKYGLMLSRGIVSDETSMKLTKAALKNKQNIQRTRSQASKIANRQGKYHRPHPDEYFNKKGTCPLQLKQKLFDFIHCNHELPGPGNRGKPIYQVLKRRHGSWSAALQSYGLPSLNRVGTNMLYTFKDGEEFKYNINRYFDREALYNKLVEKCPDLAAAA